MFTDIAGYSTLSHADEARALQLLQEQERLVRPLLESHRGRQVKSMGDGLLLEFPDALDAVECGVELQRRVHERNAEKNSPPLQIRVGIHLGDVQRRGADILGDAVNIASRLEPLADPGGVCLSEHVFAQVHNKVAYQFEGLGPRNLKGVSEPIDVYKVVLPWAVGKPTLGESASHRLAVLPLSNFSPDASDDYFADGMTEELISTISRVRELNVISRTSVMQYKNQSKHVAEIGRELDVDTVLEGSVRKAGNRVRVAVQLIDARGDKHLWAENYDRSLEDVFAIQSEIAQKIASALEIRILEPDRERIAKASTEVTEAHLLYMKGKYHYERETKEEFTTALWYFDQAIQKDPKYALAYAAAAETYNFLVFWELVPVQETIAKAEVMARKALDLDPSLAESHLALWGVLNNTWDNETALKEARRAIDLNPSLARAHIAAGLTYSYAGHREEGVREAEMALELDPLSETTIGAAANIHLYSRRTERATELYESLVQRDPTGSWRGNLGLCYVRAGKYDEGITEIRRSIESSPTMNPPQHADLAYALGKAGRIEEARNALTKLIDYHRTHGTGATSVAYAHAAVGDWNEAFRWLERAYEERSPYLGAVSQDFSFEPMHTDPRFLRLLKKMSSRSIPRTTRRRPGRGPSEPRPGASLGGNSQ
jgi:adenylate cyclase